MKKKMFPAGKPEEDLERIKAWWAEEMERAGLSGEVSVEYSPCQQEIQEKKSLGKKLLNMLSGDNPVSEAHMYHASIPGAPWPMEALLLTTDAGVVTQVIYHARFKKKLPGATTFVHRAGLMGSKLEIEGPDADRLKKQKDLVKKLKTALSFRYEVPLRGFHSGKQFYEHGPATLTATPDENGSALTSNSTVHAEAKFASKNYTLGLNWILDAIRELEQTA